MKKYSKNDIICDFLKNFSATEGTDRKNKDTYVILYGIIDNRILEQLKTKYNGLIDCNYKQICEYAPEIKNLAIKILKYKERITN